MTLNFDNYDCSVFVKKLYKKAEGINGKEFFHFDEFVRFLDDNELINVNVRKSKFGNLIVKVEEVECMNHK